MPEQVIDQRRISLLTRDTMALIMAGGRGSRLQELTQWRVKPAVYFGGKFRIIDFPLSNCVNSGIRRIGVLTQYKAHSLIRHIVRGWTYFKPELGEFIDVLPASQGMSENWYAGTADAIYQNLDIIDVYNPKYLVILAGDHIYKMDYGQMVAAHVHSGASMTVGCIEVPLEEAKAFGVMAVNEQMKVTSFQEKPKKPQPVPGKPDQALASMGIYVFDREALFDVLREDAHDPDSSRDFGKDIVPRLVRDGEVHAYAFNDPVTGEKAYWRDVGTVDSFWKSNIELTDFDPELNLYDDEWPIWTYQVQLPPAKFVHKEAVRMGLALQSLISGGCIVSGAEVVGSVLFSNVKVRSHTYIGDSVVLPQVEVGRNCKISKAIIDRGCKIPEGTVIGDDPIEDRKKYRVTDEGVVLVTPDMLGQGRILNN